MQLAKYQINITIDSDLEKSLLLFSFKKIMLRI